MCLLHGAHYLTLLPDYKASPTGYAPAPHTASFPAHSLLLICSFIPSLKKKKKKKTPVLIAHFVPGTKDSKDEQGNTISFFKDLTVQ